MKLRTATLAALIVSFAALALAQAPSSPPVRIRGTISAVSDNSVSIATREGPTVTLALGEKFTVSAVKAAAISDIKPGVFIGTAAEPGAGGALVALEVLIFPENLRGTGEGHYDWDLKPGSSMTNANVSGVVESGGGRDLELTYKDGTAKVHVPPGAPIVMLVPAERADVKAGLPVFAVATRGSDGTLTALRMNVGKYGVAPPM